jgi:thiamine-phosphate pyrophosphorylase
MVFGELGADYVAFAGAPETVLELVEWWQELFEVPCVAWHADDAALVDRLLGLPADFIGLAPHLWNDAATIAGLPDHGARSAAAS